MAKTQSKSKQGYSAAYKSTNRWQTNRKTKLLKQLKLQPNNEQVKEALTNIKYRRKTPKTQEWSKTSIHVAKLFKMFSGYVNRDIFSSNPKVQAMALSAYNTKRKHKEFKEKVSYSLGARAHDGRGNLVWG